MTSSCEQGKERCSPEQRLQLLHNLLGDDCAIGGETWLGGLIIIRRKEGYQVYSTINTMQAVTYFLDTQGNIQQVLISPNRIWKLLNLEPPKEQEPTSYPVIPELDTLLTDFKPRPRPI